MIQERVLAGLQRAAAEGKFPGRPIVGEDKEGAIRDCLAHGFGLIKTAKHVGVGVSVVRRRRRLLAQWWPDYQSRAEREVASAHARFLPWDG